MMRLSRAPARLVAAPARIAAAPKVALPFYKTPEWRALVKQIKDDRGNRCERARCGGSGFVIADHMTEIRDGGAKLDPANIMLLCGPCHGKKTARAKRARLGL